MREEEAERAERHAALLALRDTQQDLAEESLDLASKAKEVDRRGR